MSDDDKVVEVVEIEEPKKTRAKKVKTDPIEDARAKTNKLLAEFQEAKVKYEEARAELHTLIEGSVSNEDRREKEREMVKAYQKSQAKKREEQAAKKGQ